MWIDRYICSGRTAVAWSFLIVLIRFGVSLKFLGGGWVSVVFALSEWSAEVLTVVGLLRGKVDSSAIGLILPLLYLSPVVLSAHGCSPPPIPTAILALVFMALIVSQLVVRVWMGRAISVGCAVYGGAVLCGGPWSLVRHPLAMIEGLIICVYVTLVFSWYNVASGCVALVCSLATVWIEETFLRQFQNYRLYCSVVTHRFLPGVI